MPVSSINKTGRPDILVTEILLKVLLNIMTPPPPSSIGNVFKILFDQNQKPTLSLDGVQHVVGRKCTMILY
jgi:hypothetical protein